MIVRLSLYVVGHVSEGNHSIVMKSSFPNTSLDRPDKLPWKWKLLNITVSLVRTSPQFIHHQPSHQIFGPTFEAAHLLRKEFLF
jgi:hypothetical protein